MTALDKALPQFLGAMLDCLPPKEREGVEELRLREGFPLSAVQAGEEWTHPAWRNRPLTEEDLRRVVETAGRGSVHTILDQLRGGYVTAPGGVRLGICGEGAVRDGALLSFRRITSLALRVPHTMEGIARPLLPRLNQGGQVPSTLILSPPGLGKTSSAASPWGRGRRPAGWGWPMSGESWGQGSSATPWAPGPTCWKTAPRTRPC